MTVDRPCPPYLRSQKNGTCRGRSSTDRDMLPLWGHPEKIIEIKSVLGRSAKQDVQFKDFSQCIFWDKGTESKTFFVLFVFLQLSKLPRSVK